jgi:hypothetical protein
MSAKKRARLRAERRRKWVEQHWPRWPDGVEHRKRNGLLVKVVCRPFGYEASWRDASGTWHRAPELRSERRARGWLYDQVCPDDSKPGDNQEDSDNAAGTELAAPTESAQPSQAE